MDLHHNYNASKISYIQCQVASCSGCNQYESYIAMVVGILGGTAYMITTWLVLFKLRIDDPLDATAGECRVQGMQWVF